MLFFVTGQRSANFWASRFSSKFQKFYEIFGRNGKLQKILPVRIRFKTHYKTFMKFNIRENDFQHVTNFIFSFN